MSRLDNIRKWLLDNKLAVLIILCAAILRMWRIQDFAMFLADQGRDAIIIRNIALLNHLPLIGPPSSIGQVYLGPFFYYLMAPFLLLSFFNPAGLALGTAILWIMGLTVAYVVISHILNRKTGILFLLLCAFSYQLLMLSRFSWNPNLLPVFAFLTLFFLYKALTEKHYLYSLLFGAFFGLSFQLHHLAAFLAVPITLGYLYVFVTDNKRKSLLTSPFIAFLAFIAISSPLILFDLKHGFLNAKNLSSLFAHQNVVAGGSPMERLIATNSAFWQIALHMQFPDFAASLLSIILFITILIALYRQKRKLFLLMHAVNFFSFIYFFSLLSSPRHPHYFGPAYLSFFVLIALLLSFLWRKLAGKLLVAGLLFLFIGLSARDYYFISGKSNSQMDHSERVAQSIMKYTEGKPFNFATYPVEFTSEEAFLYYLQKEDYKSANREAGEVTDQMFVLCNEEPCNILNSGSWNIDMFGKAKIDTMWEVDGIQIFRLVHDR